MSPEQLHSAPGTPALWPADEAAVTVVLINKMAALFKKDRERKSRKTIGPIVDFVEKFDHVEVIEVDSIATAIERLSELSANGKINKIILVGGDGTFFHTLQWAVTLPEEERPLMYCVGGGAFNYMRRFQKMPYKKPLDNIKFLFGRANGKDEIAWQPVLMEEPTSGRKWYASVVADGVIANFMDWLEKIGKGGAFKVFSMIVLGMLAAIADGIITGLMDWLQRNGKGRMLKAAAGVALAMLTALLSPLKRFSKGMSMAPTPGGVKIDAKIMPSKSHYGVVVSTVPDFALGISPFTSLRAENQLNCAAYWGSLLRLGLSIWFLSYGRVPAFVSKFSHNTPVYKINMVTPNRVFVMDGELMKIPPQGENDGNSTPLHLVLSAGPTIRIGYINR